ncbi:hypothetical protein CKAH01_03698 [Colletotrichum kahawae]|uniref:Uncharacterized protein n=1 Tax=Colletotrichum kahawae TaxID=34407 RepID=A0AAD9YRG4_COLKA|nr:hypothetical protein CKAH01_03698 [Colletotrichum kahawae]
MQTSTMKISLVATLLCIPSAMASIQIIPVLVAAAVLGGISVGGTGMTAGIVSGVVSGAVGVGIGCATKSGCKRQEDAIHYARNMAREVAAEIAADMEKRQDGPGAAPVGVPQHNWDDCYNEALASHITITGPIGDNHIRAEGVPPTCMTLATVIGGTAVQAIPIPCGSACMEWTNMTPEFYENVRGMLNVQVLNA